MAKGIRERLLEQVGKFHQWQEITYPGKTTERLASAWEVDLPCVEMIYLMSFAMLSPNRCRNGR